MKFFMRKSAKIIVIIALIAIIVAIAIFFNIGKNHKLEEYKETMYNYFAMYSDDGKVGVIDKKGKLMIVVLIKIIE